MVIASVRRHNPCAAGAVAAKHCDVSLAELITNDIGAIRDYLDGLGPEARWAELSRLSRDRQRELYQKAGGRAIDLTHFVGDAMPLVDVVHDGRNTLPLPSPLRLFQKHFCRPEGEPGYLVGFNDGPMRRFIGPGYFVAEPGSGSVVFDYDRVPDSAPTTWPPVVPNSTGLQRFVFNGTRDEVRGVSRHVSVGAAFRDGKPIDHYFVLCRRV